MTDDTQHDAGDPGELIVSLRGQAEQLERELAEARKVAREAITMADLRIAATRAGMVDLDGLKLVDLAGVRTTDDGQVLDAPNLMADLRRAKPWLFSAGSTSSLSGAPSAQPIRQKLATEMTDEEYRAARALILKRQG